MLSEHIMLEHFGDVTIGKANSDVNNLVQASWKSEEEVVECLEKRYLEGKVYTWAGIALLAINPCVEIPHLFTRQVKEQYSDIRNVGKKELSPHVYAVAARAHYKLTEGLGQSNQVIVISGDSGSGKTYTAWHVLNFVASCNYDSGRGMSDMIWQICCSMPVLSAFGNAQTTCNNNSSRFGKLLQLQHKNGQIVGAYFETYLLEKTRTASLPKNERNFHIFHQLLAGLEEDDCKRFYLNPETKYKIVPGPVTQKDRDSFYETKNALISIGITALLKIQVFQVLAALLHLGNINFIRSASCYAYELDLYDEDSYNGFESASKLLGLEETSLSNLLTTTLIIAPTGGRYRRTVYQKPAVTPEECQFRRDCFMRFIYERLFRWIVAHINSRVAANSSTSLLGILDIYGFEVFENNSLEQLCINYANERLQLFFTRDFLTQQKDLLQNEDHELQLLSHGHSLERVIQLDGPSSVFSVLNEECLLQRYSNEPIVSTRFVSNLSSNKYVSVPRCASSQEEFIVKHYAGDVCYSTQGMLEKNTDKVPREFLDVLRTSNNDFVHKLLDIVEMEQATAVRKNTLLIKFKNSVDTLCKILEKADTHYIRCIKASTHFTPRVVDPVFLHQQLQASGILEIISLSHLYFPIRLKFDEFKSRYASCWKDSVKIKINSDSNHVQLIAERILVPLKVEKQVKFGRESLFLSEVALLKLEKWRSEQRVRAASVIQRAWRRTRKGKENRGVRYSYRLRLVTDSGRGDTGQTPHRGTPSRVTGLQGSGDAVRMQKETVAKKTQRCLQHYYVADGIISRQHLAQVPIRFHVRATCLPFSHMLPYSELPHGLEDALQ